MATDGAGDGLIPENTWVTVRLVGCDRKPVRDPADQAPTHLDVLWLEVVGGPHAGKPVRRHCWHTLGGAEGTLRTARAFGLLPEELHRGLGRGRRARAKVGVGRDKLSGEVYNTARWFEPERPAVGGGVGGEAESADPMDTAGAF